MLIALLPLNKNLVAAASLVAAVAAVQLAGLVPLWGPVMALPEVGELAHGWESHQAHASSHARAAPQLHRDYGHNKFRGHYTN
jgi:hypothetical protein